MEQVKMWKLKISGFSIGIHLKTHKMNKSPLYNHTKALYSILDFGDQDSLSFIHWSCEK